MGTAVNLTLEHSDQWTGKMGGVTGWDKWAGTWGSGGLRWDEWTGWGQWMDVR